MAQFEETVNNLQTQLTAVQAAIEGNSQGSIFKPKTFSGALNEDINEWLSKFERFAKFYSWGAAKKLGAMVLLFEGPALSWFQTLSQDVASSYNELVDALKVRFGATNIDFILRQELYARRQGQSEPLTSYTEDIIKRCQRLGLNDTDLMNIFVNGLAPELKSHVVLNQPKTFSEAENLARLRDAVYKSSGPSLLATPSPSNQDQRIKELEGQVNLLLSLATTSKSSNQPNLHAISSESIPKIGQPFQSSVDKSDQSAANQNMQQFTSEIIAALQDVAKNQNNAPKGRPRSFNQNYGAPRGRNLRTTDGQPICNYCHRVGHVARYCQQRNNGPQSYSRSQLPQQQRNPTVRSQSRFYPQPPYQQNLNENGPSTWGQ